MFSSRSWRFNSMSGAIADANENICSLFYALSRNWTEATCTIVVQMGGFYSVWF